MDTSVPTLESWCISGPATLHGYEDDLVYLLIQADTDDPERQREVALVGAWDLEGERYARIIAAAPKLVAACQSVVERWEHGDLAAAAQMCDEAVRQAMGTEARQIERSSTAADAAGGQRPLEQLLAKAEAAGLRAEDFDETVHELAASIAADVNNEGLEGQLRYLIGEWGGQAAAQHVDRLAAERWTSTHNQ